MFSKLSMLKFHSDFFIKMQWEMGMGTQHQTFQQVAPLIHFFQMELDLECWFFVEGGKLKEPETNPQCKDKNQQQTLPTCETGSGN